MDIITSRFRLFGLAAGGAATMLLTQVAPAQETSPVAEERNRALVQNSFEAWRNGTGSPYDLLAEDAEWTITGNSAASKTYPGREAFMSEVIRPFNARMRTRLVPQMRKLYAEGDTVIALFDARGTARDGKTTPTPMRGSSRCAMAGSSGRMPFSTASRSTISGPG